MNDFERKIRENFKGVAVRKDLTAMMKKDVNVPTYVLEFLLGKYCVSDNEADNVRGLEKVKKILNENYVRPDQSELIKSRIREKGSYQVIDKVAVEYDDHADVYVAKFSNLRIGPLEIAADQVIHNEKLLVGGAWCFVELEYAPTEDDSETEYEEDIFGNRRKKKAVRKKKARYDSTFSIHTLKLIQLQSFEPERMSGPRSCFAKDEWIDLLLLSIGYEPNEMETREKLHYLLRLVPFVQKNYNLVELGPRGTGKSHIYSELSPYSILISSGQTTVSNMFYNMASKSVGLVGYWDCVAFDEVAGITRSSKEMVQIMKNYMANGTFARGRESVTAGASICFEGNTFRSVADMLRKSTLFEPFPKDFNNDSAFFDRIHAYLPGWEMQKLRTSMFTARYGLISDMITEYCHAMRTYDFTDRFDAYYKLNKHFNTRDDIAVRRTFAGMAKLIYPNGEMSKEETRELLEYAIEGRRRVKEQLQRMNPSEFGDVGLGFIDLETGQETVVVLPENTGILNGAE